jgi:hypothetical protein
MHGLSLGNQDSRTSSASLPLPRLPAQHGSTFRSPSASSSRPEPIFESGLLLARNENSFPSPISRSLLPTYFFPIHRTFAESAPSPMFRTAPPAPASLQGFLCPPGSQRSASLAVRKPTCASRPISLRSPWPDSINDDGRGSTFQVRYAPRGSLFSCTSWNRTIMRRISIRVKQILPFSSRFPQVNDL